MRAAAPELWGGIECTVNRVQDHWFSQIHRSGHSHRIEDLERIAELGIRTLRYPVLWEHCAPHRGVAADFHWADERLRRLHALGIKPIVGLLHHGSGPAYTNLIDPEFPELFADYARRFATRFPEVGSYVPVNEPLTTARFCGLYGHWYPHGHDDRTFVSALLNQTRATVLAMRAIRRVNPDATLIQTDDLGRVYSTRHMAYQAEFENERRWITWDLLCGKVDRRHPLWDYLAHAAGSADTLDWLLHNPCPPDLIGINHYITSNRYLDEAWANYPQACQGGNGRDRYADVEAVRVIADRPASFAELLAECWERYRLPVALTEVQIGCTPDEQVRWLSEAWQGAHLAKGRGVDVKGVTAWALLGSYDWHCLVTRVENRYEAGAFDVSNGTLRPTRLAEVIATLIQHRNDPDLPELSARGWWRKPERLTRRIAAPRAELLT